MEYTEGIPSPEIFRLWAGITAVSGALERRVWINTARSLLFPHMYVLLVSPPGIGKSQAITPVSDLWGQVRNLKVSPDNLTKASLVDALGAAKRVIHPGGKMVEFNSMQVAAGELGVFLSAHDLEFLSVLNYIYDAPRRYKEERRHALKETLEIHYPQLTILAGTQPGFLSSLLPEEAWSMGFCSRIIMIYSSTSPEVELFSNDDLLAGPDTEFTALRSGLNSMSSLYGPFHWEDAAKIRVAQFNTNRRANEPDHTKLQHYNSRRVLHVLKLTMVSAISARNELRILESDVERAMDWLFSAEQAMPDIFREMSRRSDTDVLAELHRFVWKIYNDDPKRQPIHEARIINFLSAHLPSDKIKSVFDIAQKSSMVQRVAGTEQFYVPRPKNEHGME